MSATRPCLFLGATPLTLLLRTSNALTSLSLPRFTAKPLFPQTLRSRRYTYSAASVETAIEIPKFTPQEIHHHQYHHNYHPWPEWVVFVDHLKSRGYFPQTSSSNDGVASQLVYREIKLLKDPCLSFARDRYDIFRSLPKGDIRTIVEGGCPKLLRKVVNSAKRLRLYVGLDEQNVCSACSLRESCDRAYVMLKESEGDARTVDLMRLLLFFALDPLVISGPVSASGIEQAESSAMRLLSMFVDLSGASPALAAVEPPKSASFQKQFVKPVDSVLPRNELERENGRCPKCNSFNFVRSSGCQSCSEGSPKKAGHPDIKIKQGDWICSGCSFINFSRNVRCLRCKTEAPKQGITRDVEIKKGKTDASKQGIARDVEMKKGDWNCPQCGCMNFASRRDCFRCKDPRPPRSLMPGEWECPKCDFLNFRRNVACLKCGNERNKEAVAQCDEQIWRKPL